MKGNHVLLLSLIYLLSIGFTGCNVKGLTSGYKKLSQQQRAAIHSAASLYADAVRGGALYHITGATLRTWIKDEDRALVYLWVPHCTGTHCYSLRAFASYAAEQKLKLYIVADAYEMEEIHNQLSSDYPVYIIDAAAYHSNLRNTYRKAFVKELIGRNSLPDSVLYAGNLFFRHDTLQAARQDLYNAK